MSEVDLPDGSIGARSELAQADPNAVLVGILEAEHQSRVQLASARERMESARLLARDAEGEWRNIPVKLSVPAAVDSALRAAGVKNGLLDSLLKVQRERKASWHLQFITPDRDRAIKQAINEVKAEFDSWVQQQHSQYRSLVESRAARMARLRPQLAALRPMSDPSVESIYLAQLGRPRDHYAGSALADMSALAGLTPIRWASPLWTVDPLPDEPLARLPYLAHRICSTTWLAGSPGLDYQDACQGVRGLVLEEMARSAPRRLSLTWIDPGGRGSTAGAFLELLEIDKALLDSQVWVERDQIAEALRRISDRISYLEQRCLKDRFDRLEDYNAQAGRLAEPYHVLVVTGYPYGLDDDAVARIRHIAETGSRVGVAVHVVTAPEIGASCRVQESVGFPSEVSWNRGTFDYWNPQSLPQDHLVVGHKDRPHARVDRFFVPVWPLLHDPVVARAIVEGYARAAVESTEVVIDPDEVRLEPSDVAGSTSEEVAIPVGVLGRGEPLMLRLGKGLSQNVLVGGLPGSGKSTFFHTAIVQAIRAYGPEELELYLLDFKQGVEFQPYAKHALPHARVIAIQSEREFGLSVLRSLRDEIDRRAALFRGPEGAGSDSLKDYRERTGQPMPRILVIVDEFQVMFSTEDALAHEAAGLLDHLVRQGRAFGVHTILGTQTLRGHGSMGILRGTLDQIAIRVVLKTSETDSQVFLADGNTAGATVTRPGEAIYNPDGGRSEGNLRFQVFMTADEKRDAALVAARIADDVDGGRRKPLVFDGTRAISVQDDDEVTALMQGGPVPRRAVPCHIGLPVSIGGSGSVGLWRRAGSHLLLLDRDSRRLAGSLIVAMATALTTDETGAPPDIRLVDCLGPDEEGTEDLEVAARTLGVLYTKRFALAKQLQELADLVEERIDTNAFRERRTILVLNALHRARELGEEADYPEPGTAAANLQRILADGADMGVHVIAACDSLSTARRRLGTGGMSACGSRVIGQCSADASQSLLGTDAASRLGDVYALISEPDDDRLEKIRLFPAPPPDWLTHVASRIHGRL